MKKEYAETELNKMLNSEITQTGIINISDLFKSYDELLTWCKQRDEVCVITLANKIEITGFKKINYTIKDNNSILEIFIIVMKNGKVFSFGYDLKKYLNIFGS